MVRVRNGGGVTAVAITVLLLSACGTSARRVAATPSPSATSPAASPATTAPAPAFADPALTTVGKTQTVYDWTHDRCSDDDIPDLGARAFRDASGKVQLIAAHVVDRRFVGTSLDTIKQKCQIVLTSPHDADPARFDDNEWLAAPYTTDGKTIYSLVHEEYHGHEHPGQCPQHSYFPCWYNSITLAVSTNSGASYHLVGSPPHQLVATLPHKYEAGAGPSGVFEPSNIVKGPGGYLYAFVRIDEYKSDAQRICLIRTNHIADPGSWRAWDGSGGFTVAFVDPYHPPAGPVQDCAAVDPYDLGVIGASITFNKYLNEYVAVGTTTVHIGDEDVWGVGYSFSTDLVNWSPRKLLFAAELPWTYQPGDANVYLYPSLIDPNSTSRTFDTTGRTAYLYLTRFNTKSGGMTLDRDLVRIPVKFFSSQVQAQSATVKFRP